MMTGIRGLQTLFSYIAFANTNVFDQFTWATQSHILQKGNHCPLTEDSHAWTQSLTLSLRTINYTVQASI